MKVLGLSCGRPMGNSEILLKEALMAAEAQGAEVEMIRLMDLKIKPCLGCNGCILGCIEGGDGNCVIKDDDVPFFREKYLESDALIISFPAYNNTAPGYFRMLGDRCGPPFDRGSKIYIRDVRHEYVDERWYKDRPAGCMVVGGGPITHMHTALPLMYQFFRSGGVKVVDQFAATFCAAPGQVLTHPDYVEKAAALGANVVSQIGKKSADMEWKGDSNYVCDVCHGTAVVFDEKNGIHCAACLRPGKLEIVDGVPKIVFGEFQRPAGAKPYAHAFEIKRSHEEFASFTEEHKAEFDRYRNYNKIVKPERG